MLKIILKFKFHIKINIQLINQIFFYLMCEEQLEN